MAIIRRISNLPMGGCLTGRKRKMAEMALPTVDSTSASSSSDDDDDEGCMSDDSDSSCVLSSSSTRHQQRVVSPYLGTRVHFAEDYEEDEDEEDEQQEEDECPPPAADLDYLQERKADLWYSKATRQCFSADALEIIQCFKREHPEPTAQFGSLYQAKATAGENKDPSSSSPTTTANVVHLPLSMRGLEWGITPALKKLRQNHIRQVLTACDIPNQEKRERVVAARSRASSARAADVARKLAADILFLDRDEYNNNEKSDSSVASSDATANKSVATGLPPREPLQNKNKRMRLWQR